MRVCLFLSCVLFVYLYDRDTDFFYFLLFLHSDMRFVGMGGR